MHDLQTIKRLNSTEQARVDEILRKTREDRQRQEAADEVANKRRLSK